MVKNTVHPNDPPVNPPAPHVRLADETQAGIHDGQLWIQYQSRLLSMIDLESAVKMAVMVLQHAQRCGITVSEAAADMASVPGDEWGEGEYPPIFA